MKISEINESHLDELDAADVGKAAGKTAKAVGSGLAKFGRGFKKGFTGKSAAPKKKAAPKTKSKRVAALQKSLGNLDARELQALKQQLSKKAGTA